MKPGFFQNEQLAELPFEARLLFIGLWCMADREGRLENRPKRIKMNVFPADSIDVEPLLDGLEGRGLIERYEAKGVPCIEIPKFLEHQRPHHQERASQIPQRVRTKVRSGSHQGASQSALNPDTGYLNPECSLREGVPGLNEKAWETWEAYRREIRKPIKPASMLAAQRKLAGFGAGQAAVVEQSIANGWQGIFPLKPANGAPETQKLTRYERSRRALLAATMTEEEEAANYGAQT